MNKVKILFINFYNILIAIEIITYQEKIYLIHLNINKIWVSITINKDYKINYKL
jgi:hypothetical protein